MSLFSPSRLTLLSVLGFALAACSDTPTGPSNQPLDLSALLAEMNSSPLGSMTSLATPTFGVVAMPGNPALDPGDCTYSANTGFFVCPTSSRGGMTFTRMFRLIDDAGNSQSAPGPKTTAVETRTTVDGTLTPPAGAPSGLGTITMSGSSDMTLSGIRTDKHTLNGTSTMTMAGTFDFGGTSVPMHTAMTQTTTNLVLPNVKAGQKWPQSGSIAIDETSDADGSGTPETSRIVMTFDGTSVVKVTITDSFGTSNCQIDLASGGLGRMVCS